MSARRTTTPGYVKLHVSLPPDVLRALKVRAATDGLPMSRWVTRALRALLAPSAGQLLRTLAALMEKGGAK